MPEYFTSREVAELTGLSRETVRALARRGEIAAVRIGRQWRFPPQVVEGLDLRKGFWNVENAARVLRVSQETVRRQIRKRQLPGVKVGRRWFIPAGGSGQGGER